MRAKCRYRVWSKADPGGDREPSTRHADHCCRYLTFTATPRYTHAHTHLFSLSLASVSPRCSSTSNCFYPRDFINTHLCTTLPDQRTQVFRAVCVYMCARARVCVCVCEHNTSSSVVYKLVRLRRTASSDLNGQKTRLVVIRDFKPFISSVGE